MAPIGTLLQKGDSSYQKYHLTTMAPYMNGAQHKWRLIKMVSQNLLHQLVFAVHIKFSTPTSPPIFTVSTYEE